jgi:hypothetical protein
MSSAGSGRHLMNPFTARALARRIRLGAGIATVAVALGGAARAEAATWKQCSVKPGFPVRTISVRAMACGDAAPLVARLFRDNPNASSTPLGRTRRFRTTGKTGGRTRRLSCSVRYSRGGAGNRGGIQLTVRCRDYRGYGMNYTEQQDNE